MSLRAWDPFDNNRWETQMSRIFGDFLSDLGTNRRDVGRRGTQGWAPPIDVHETEKEYVVNAEVPGVDKKDINIDLRDNALVISGESSQDKKWEEGSTHIQERRFGSFTRSIGLPRNVKHEEIQAKFDKGILEVRIPKSEAALPKKISIE